MEAMVSELLTQFKAKRDAIGTQALAEAIGIKGSAVRMVCTGHYPNPQNVLAKFAAHYIDIVACPFAGRSLPRTECQQRATGPRPFGGLSKINWWEHCQTCPNK